MDYDDEKMFIAHSSTNQRNTHTHHHNGYCNKNGFSYPKKKKKLLLLVMGRWRN